MHSTSTNSSTHDDEAAASTPVVLMASTSPRLLLSTYCATPPLKDSVVYPPRIFVGTPNSSAIIISRRRFRLTAALGPKSKTHVYTVLSASSVPRGKIFFPINPEDALSVSTNVAKISASVITLLPVAV
jgi:hypothetical protein